MTTEHANTEADAEDVIELILDQHDAIMGLFDALECQPDPDTFQCLVRLLAAHETAEEEVVYPALRQSDGPGDRVVEQRLSEEHQGKVALSSLEQLDVGSLDFREHLTDLREAVDEHASNEEREVLPLLRRAVDAGRREQMAVAFRTAERIAPTHPHPHGPDSAVGNLVAGPFAAIADHVRDAIHGGR